MAQNMHTKVQKAHSLASDAECIFWSIVTNKNLLVIRADMSNAFTEALAPAKCCTFNLTIYFVAGGSITKDAILFQNIGYYKSIMHFKYIPK
jgi:hypothetical protein